jgi:hypothetical protein
LSPLYATPLGKAGSTQWSSANNCAQSRRSCTKIKNENRKIETEKFKLVPDAQSMPPCSPPSRTPRAADAVAAKSGSSLTAAARDGKYRVQVGTEGWSQSNKRIRRSTLPTKHGSKRMLPDYSD